LINLPNDDISVCTARPIWLVKLRLWKHYAVFKRDAFNLLLETLAKNQKTRKALEGHYAPQAS